MVATMLKKAMIVVAALLLIVSAMASGNDVNNAQRIGGHPIIFDGHHGSGELTKCPWACSCTGLSVDCSHRGLTQVPRNLPPDAERV